MSAEATVVRNYLDWMTELPWHKKSAVDIDLKKALEILDKDHFGLEKVCLLYTSPSPRDRTRSRMPSSA